MIDHIGIAVSDIERARVFYCEALKPLGYHVVTTLLPDQTESHGMVVMFGAGDTVDFVIGDNERVGEGTHVAFRAETRAQVDAFHAAALAAGGRDNGPPGLRDDYGPHYYAAFVHDPDGVNVEAVCHTPV